MVINVLESLTRLKPTCYHESYRGRSQDRRSNSEHLVEDVNPWDGLVSLHCLWTTKIHNHKRVSMAVEVFVGFIAYKHNQETIKLRMKNFLFFFLNVLSKKQDGYRMKPCYY